ncbi:MAG: AAC(3) family N-acetyltransferase [Clostridia bacterium]|nr:AAC(3) family N-acetyltransferase [Clostridia bacterium]
MLTVQEVTESLKRLGINNGDAILIHSSFKSLGETENGADTVIKGMQKAVGENGTVVFPTLCQDDWEHVYENWTLDSKSDVGYLTNYFRTLPGVYRSNQATHSVAAMGKMAEYITKTHGQSGQRYGIFGDTPFSADSPWEKMYNLDTKVIFVGVGIRKCTFRHYAEYCFIEKYLKRAEKSAKYEQLKRQVWHYDYWDEAGVWPHVNSEYVQKVLESQGKIYKSVCGNAELLMVSSKDFVNTVFDLLEKKDISVFSENHKIWNVEKTMKWLKEIEEL